MNIFCPHCRTPLEVPDEWAGRQAQCSQCKKAILIPPAPPEPKPYWRSTWEFLGCFVAFFVVKTAVDTLKPPFFVMEFTYFLIPPAFMLYRDATKKPAGPIHWYKIGIVAVLGLLVTAGLTYTLEHYSSSLARIIDPASWVMLLVLLGLSYYWTEA